MGHASALHKYNDRDEGKHSSILTCQNFPNFDFSKFSSIKILHHVIHSY